MYKEAGKICFDSDLCQSQHAGKLCSQPVNLPSVRPVKPLLKLIVFSEILWKPVLP